MSLKTAYRTDKSLTEEGSWFTFADGSEWLIRKATSKRAQAAMAEVRKPYAELIRSMNARGEELPADVADKINVQYATKGLVVSWRKLVDEDLDASGKEIPYSLKQCESYLSEMPDLLLDVVRSSTGLVGYQKRAEEVKEATKNSLSD